MADHRILSFDDFDEAESKKLREAVVQAERGYTDEELSRARRGRPLEVGDKPATNIIKVRLDDEREQRLDRFAARHNLNRSAAVRQILDTALADA